MSKVAQYLRAHWLGDLSLAISTFINGLALYLALIFLLVPLGVLLELPRYSPTRASQSFSFGSSGRALASFDLPSGKFETFRSLSLAAHRCGGCNNTRLNSLGSCAA